MDSSNVFEQMANRYDTQERIDNAAIIAKEIRANLTDTKDKTALDYGCGTGLVGLGLVDLFASVLFVDASTNMIEQVERKIQSLQLTTASTLCADFLAGKPSLQVDYIIMAQVLLHIKDSRAILSRMFEILKEGGHLIIVDFDKNDKIPSDRVHNGFEQKELIRMVKEIGFASAKAYTFYHGQKIFMNEDASMFLLNARK